MAETDDAIFLRQLWSPEFLGPYEGKWIAFRYTFDLSELPSDVSLQPLLAHFQDEIDSGNGPIFAFVTFADVFA